MPLTDTILWADGFILVYSITDRNSFNYIRCEHNSKNYLAVLQQQTQNGLIIPEVRAINLNSGW